MLNPISTEVDNFHQEYSLLFCNGCVQAYHLSFHSDSLNFYGVWNNGLKFNIFPKILRFLKSSMNDKKVVCSRFRLGIFKSILEIRAINLYCLFPCSETFTYSFFISFQELAQRNKNVLLFHNVHSQNTWPCWWNLVQMRMWKKEYNRLSTHKFVEMRQENMFVVIQHKVKTLCSFICFFGNSHVLEKLI